MKILNKIGVALATFSLSSGVSSAALLFTFTESGSDVVLTVSGSVDVTNATFNSDGTLQPFSTAAVNSQLVYSGVIAPTVAFDELIGVDLLPGNLVTNQITTSNVSGLGDFEVNGSKFRAYSTSDSSIANDGAQNAALVSSSKVITFTGQSFASMGLDAHQQNVNIGLWKATAASGDNETVYFNVSTVPEPSSSALLALGGIALLIRRKK